MISIIIPTRNRGEAFKRALHSALNQTVDCEIVVSDHNSTDGTGDYVRSLHDDRITYTRQGEDACITDNWLLAFHTSTGEWVKYLFDDDYLEPECCERLLYQTGPDTTVSQCGATFAWTGQHVYNTWNPSIPIPTAVRAGVLSVSPVTALLRRDAVTVGFHYSATLLTDRAWKSGVGPNVLINYATVASEPERMAYTSDILCHLDDLPGPLASLTTRLRRDDPATLSECHDEAYDLLETL